MTELEFAKKWGMQQGKGYGSALFDCSKRLLEDLHQLRLPKILRGDIIRTEHKKKTVSIIIDGYIQGLKQDMGNENSIIYGINGHKILALMELQKRLSNFSA